MDSDVENSDTDSPTAAGKQGDGVKQEQRRKKRERTEKDDNDSDGDKLDDKLDPEKEAEIIRAIGTRRDGETLSEHQRKGIYLYYLTWAIAQYDCRRAGTVTMQSKSSWLYHDIAE